MFLLLPFVQYFLIEIFRQIFILQYFTCVTFWEDLPVVKNKEINMTRKPTFNLHMLSICDWTWYFQVLKTLGWGGPLPVFFCCCCWDRVASHRLRWSSHDCSKISLGIGLRTGWKLPQNYSEGILQKYVVFERQFVSQKKKIKLRVLVSWTLNLIPHHTEPWNTSLYCTTYTLTVLSCFS